MTTYIALVRGLGGKYIVPMKELVRLLERMGLRDVRTYIQSGNAVFRSRKVKVPALAEQIKAAIHRKYGFGPEIIILRPGELSKAMADNPFPEAEPVPTSLHLSFLSTVAKNPDLAALERLRKPNERFALKGKVFYFQAPEGVGKSKAFARVEKSLGVPCTARNWRSVCNIRGLAEQLA